MFHSGSRFLFHRQKAPVFTFQKAPPNKSAIYISRTTVLKKINILSFALASDARDSHTPVSDQGDCPPPLPALLTQDSMPRERRHMAGVTWEGGSVVLFGALGRVYPRRPWPCLRFRTNDVLLGTSGVGVRFSVVSIQLFRPVNIYYYFRLYRFRNLPPIS